MDNDDSAGLSASQQENLDDSFRIVAVSSAVLIEAENNPQFHAWLASFLDARLEGQDERNLFDFLPARSHSDVIPFPAMPPRTL